MKFNKKPKFNGDNAEDPAHAERLQRALVCTGSIIPARPDRKEQDCTLPMMSLALSHASGDTSSPIVRISGAVFQLQLLPSGAVGAMVANTIDLLVSFDESEGDPEHLSAIGYDRETWLRQGKPLPTVLASLSGFITSQRPSIAVNQRTGTLASLVPVVYNAPATIGKLRNLYMDNRQQYPFPYHSLDVLQLVTARLVLIEANLATVQEGCAVGLPPLRLEQVYAGLLDCLDELWFDHSDIDNQLHHAPVQAATLIPTVLTHALTGSLYLMQYLRTITTITPVDNSVGLDSLTVKVNNRRTRV